MHSSTGARSSGGRRSTLRLVLAGGLFAGVLIGRNSTPSALQAPRPAGRSFEQDVRPVLEEVCSATERPVWLAAFKSALGCGGSLQSESLILQGDQRERLPPILRARGVKKIIVS